MARRRANDPDRKIDAERYRQAQARELLVRFAEAHGREAISIEELEAWAIGQAYAALPEEARSAVREEVRHGLGDTGGAIAIDCQIRLASGSR